MTAVRPGVAHLRRWQPRFVALTVGAFLLLLASASLASAQTLNVGEAGGGVFPSRTLILSVPQGIALTPARVHITENGRAVTGLTVVSLSQDNRGELGMILAIDSDPSMGGAPLIHAMAAARALAAERTGNEQLGLVYGDGTTIPLTTDPAVIGTVLQRPPRIGHALNLLQATKSAIDELTAARIADSAVIFITDDIDRDPTDTPQSVAAYARAAHVRVFVVQVRDAVSAHPNPEDLPPSSMKLLAESSGGTFTEASPAQLGAIFTSIEEGLKSQYVVSYHSTQGLGRTISYSVSVDGVSGMYTGSYKSPLAVLGSRPAKRQADRSFWLSSAALVLASFGAAALLGVAVALVLSHYARAGSLRRRVKAFLPEGPAAPVLLPASSSDEISVLARRSWWPAFEEKVDIGRMSRSATQLVYLTAAGSVLTGILLQAATGLLPLAIVAMFIPPLILRMLVNRAVDRQRLLFMDQFPGLVHEVAGAMRTGRSLVEALAAVSATADEPSGSEFERTVADERAGRNIEDALRPVGERMSCEEIEQVAIVAALHRRTGANITEVLDHVADTARQRAEIRRELRGLTAQARLSRNVLVALPPFVVIALSLVGRGFEKPLFDTFPGVALLVVCTVMVAVGAKIMKAIVNIEE